MSAHANVGTQDATFPRSFWTANLTELFERGAYYAMASFVVVYLGQMGLGDYWPSTLNSFLWSLVYFLPILSGTIADHVGFKRSLLVAFVLLGAGYFLMGYPVWFGGQPLSDTIGKEITAGTGVILPIMFGIFLIGMGGSVVKPCISGTVQKTSGVRATLGFGIFYMVINIGSLFGRGISYIVRKEFNLSYIFAVSVGCAILAFFTVLLLYRDPEKELGSVTAHAVEKKPKKSVGRILADMVLVLRNKRFAVFLLVSSGFWFVYSQVYNVIPLYLKRVVDLDPPVDLITMANPFVIVFFQLLVIKLFGKLKPINSMIIGGVIIGLSMVINLGPIWVSGGLRQMTFGDFLPLASLFAVLTVALIAFGELFAAARQFEYIGALAPKGQEGLFLGYANLPMAIGSLAGGPIGAFIFNEINLKMLIKMKHEPKINKFYISTGITGAMYTLRVERDDFNYQGVIQTFDHHCINLTRDFDTSIEKAKKYIHENGLDLELLLIPPRFELRDIESHKIDHSIIRFGKYEGQTIEQVLESDKQYLVWLAMNMQPIKKLEKTLEMIREAVAEDLQKEIEERKERERKREEMKANSVHIGTIGKREVFELVYTGNTSFESYYGWATIHFFKDANDNSVIWKTGNGRLLNSEYNEIEKGTMIKVKATVKDHGDYNGENQTILTRLVVL